MADSGPVQSSRERAEASGILANQKKSGFLLQQVT